MVYRIYVEKKPGYDVEANQLCTELSTILGVTNLTGLRLINRYDVEDISKELFTSCISTVFSEPPVDTVSDTLPDAERIFAVEYLPGQFDQRAASASECIQLISQGERPLVRSAKVYIPLGHLTDEDIEKIKHYVINPVEAREASLEKKDTLKMTYAIPESVETLTGFCQMDESALSAFIEEKGLAMDLADITFCKDYFLSEKRDPTITEIRMIDTYWSDHCRHTTFGTILENIEIKDAVVKKAFDRYLSMREELNRTKPICLMDMGTLGGKYLKAKGILKNLDESEEINACTVKIKCDVNGKDEDWLFLFKNETHNHPTEIEPFGGAATCIGGAIRDPLSGRSYVYQAMRVTGAGDPLVPVRDTIPGKLPQRKLVTTAAAGYSSYGNQIGLATGQVDELYHPGYVAKRMEIGAVVGATPASHVRREEPAPDDVIILLGGATGRDGIGGATGSSKAHKLESLETCGAEVQKGNAPIERKLQRLFRREDACRMIKRCNDFGAGGVSVAIGELADGLFIDLSKVPKKYDGLDGTELAISESQERMAVALAPEDADRFIAIAHEENLDATPVARVTAEKRLKMIWNNETIVDVSREFLNSNGAPKHMKVIVEAGEAYNPSWEGLSLAEKMLSLVSDNNVCSKKGLSERFDSTIGAATVLMPFGGKHQLTPSMAMAAKLPVLGETKTVSGMAWGFNPYLSEKNQYIGAYLAVVESVSRLVSAGFDRKNAYLTFQEYFEKLGNDPKRWGKPVASVLGALSAQADLEIAAIGGKDSMSGSFEDLDVPPTLVSFATAIGNVDAVISPEFKKTGSTIRLVAPAYQEDGITPEPDSLKEVLDTISGLAKEGKLLSAATPGYGCLAEALFKMCVGNGIGFKAFPDFVGKDDFTALFTPAYGSFLLELAEEDFDSADEAALPGHAIGITTEEYRFQAAGENIDLADLQEAWEKKLEPVLPYRRKGKILEAVTYTDTASDAAAHRSFASASDTKDAPAIKIAKPRVIIPVFPGTNCEYDSARAFEKAGAETKILVINNLSPEAVAESCAALSAEIEKSQIIMIPGGFSGGDEPDGSAKFITAFFRAPQVTEAVRNLLQKRDGLMLGICNGFQALIKLGLLPDGDIREIKESSPTLTFNTIGRHQSKLIRTRVSSTMSPWFANCKVGDIHTIAISHGEGRFAANAETTNLLKANGQIATQYVDLDGNPTDDLTYNPNGSVLAIEGITSLDGRILGKMGHSERTGYGLYKNVPGNIDQPIFTGGVEYFTK